MIVNSFKNKKVVVMGLGLLGGGVGVAKFFAKQGAKLLVTDLRTRKELKPSLEKLKPLTFRGRKVRGKGLPIKYVLGRHRKEDFKNNDLIIRNPAVPRESPYLKIAKKYKVPIKTDIDIFFDLCPSKIIGVTGTKGKSTTATLIYLLLKTKFPNIILAGNIGISPLEILPKINKNTKVVLELSSFELESLKKSPHIAVITTLFPDHLNRYKNFQDYVKAKKPIFKYQKKDDILILNADNPKTSELSSQTKSKVYFFSDSSKAAAALKVSKLFKVSDSQIKKVLANFKGVPNRQELVCVKRGVKYINDTTATTPQSVILAIKQFSKGAKLILIAGGQDKELSYKELAKEIKKNVSHLILLPGTASDKIKKELFETRSLAAARDRVSVNLVKSMGQAVKKASQLAKKGDIVLLSPGAASFTPYHFSRRKNDKTKSRKNSEGFNLFKNEFDRGKQFVRAVKNL